MMLSISCSSSDVIKTHPLDRDNVMTPRIHAHVNYGSRFTLTIMSALTLCTIGCEEPREAAQDRIVIVDMGALVGCQDPGAVNYLEGATVDSERCIYAGCTDERATNYLERASLDDGSCRYVGCTDSEASNYEPLASESDGSCVYSGCADPEADTYDERATQDDGSCIYSGCTDPEADNYRVRFNQEDGSCIYAGCTDADADNYEARFNQDDGSCMYSGCTDERAVNYEARATIDDASCIYAGCTHPAATNYDAAVSISDNSCEFPAWTSRVLYVKNVEWSSNRNIDAETLTRLMTTREVGGLMITDLDVSPSPTTGVRFSAIWRENLDGRRWRAHWNLTSEEYNQRWTQYGEEGFRPLDVEGYLVRGQLRFAGVWIEDVENLSWTSYRQMTSEGYTNRTREQAEAGRTPIDIEAYPTPEGLRFAAIYWADPSTRRDTVLSSNRASYQGEVDERLGAGERMIDYETYIDDGGVQRYATIWEEAPLALATTIRTNLSSLDFGNLWLTYRDEGQRLIDAEADILSGSQLYGGVWLENRDRYRDPRRADFVAFHDAQALNAGYPAISITVIHHGEVIYRRGVGVAIESTGQVAHSNTVYPIASISKVIGSTLAALLEREGVLRDGTPIALDLSQPARSYIPELPAHHTYTVEQLTAHRSCVGHYPHYNQELNQAIRDKLEGHQYYTALSAARDLWAVDLLPGCTPGMSRNYTTHAFTFLGAALEGATGRDLQTLLETEIFEPHGLTQTRVMYQADGLVEDAQRADLLRTENNSWKLLGGGIESSTHDIANFGWKVMTQQVVDEETLVNRLWTPLSDNCQFGDGWLCINGVGWRLILDSRGRRVAYHDGSLSGQVSALWTYPDDQLVIALMTNDNTWIDDGNALLTALADIALGN